jgi:protein arginine kinase activator
MLCQDCESKPATIHITEIADAGQKHELHLCEECAQSHNLTQGGPIPTGLTQLVTERTRASDARCPECGITFEEFRLKGRLGCPRDYEVFAKELAPLLEKIHGAQQHTGRVPRGTPADTGRGDLLRRLRRDLARAVKEENYEEAARLRDEIQSAEEAPRGPV